MLQAGLIKRHGHTQQHQAVVFTPTGAGIAAAFQTLHAAVQPVTPQDCHLLWVFLNQPTLPGTEAPGGDLP